MNLHGIVAGAISAVNPMIRATIKRSTGSKVNAAGVRVPQYSYPCGDYSMLQVQSLTFGDIQQLDGLNIQGTRRAIYAYGAISGIIRVGEKGGDLVVFDPGALAEGDVWLCAHVLEQWNDGARDSAWCKIAITLQDGS